MSMRASMSQWDSRCLERKVLAVKRKPPEEICSFSGSYFVHCEAQDCDSLSPGREADLRMKQLKRVRHKWDYTEPENFSAPEMPSAYISLYSKPVRVKFSISWSWKHANTDMIYVILKNSSKQVYDFSVNWVSLYRLERIEKEKLFWSL